MSLNEIYDGNEGRKSWQNYRFNDLNIAQNFNIDTTGANPGDILQLNGSLDYSWVPYTSTVTAPLEYCKGLFTTATIPDNGDVGTKLVIGSLSGSPVFQVVSGKIQVNEDASLLIFLNITCTPTQFSLPLITLVKDSNNGNVTLTQMSPYLNNTSSLNVSCNCIAPVQVSAGDSINVVAYTIGNSSQSCALNTSESNINILRLN